MLSPQTELALALIETIVSRWSRYEEVNDQLRTLDSDFPTRINLMDGALWRPICNLLDSVSGDTTPSYFLDEAMTMKEGGAVTERDGTRWPLKTVADLRAYLEHLSQQPEQAKPEA